MEYALEMGIFESKYLYFHTYKYKFPIRSVPVSIFFGLITAFDKLTISSSLKSLTWPP